MKLLVRKLWFPYDVDKTIDALFRIPQMGEIFDEGFEYDREMRPRGIKLGVGYWPAQTILDRLPASEKDVYLVLTSMDLGGKVSLLVQGMGYSRKAIASNHDFIYRNNNNFFFSFDIDFHSMAFHEIGHALGLEHHDPHSSNPCAISHKHYSWKSLDEIRFCNDCYKELR